MALIKLNVPDVMTFRIPAVAKSKLRMLEDSEDSDEEDSEENELKTPDSNVDVTLHLNDATEKLNLSEKLNLNDVTCNWNGILEPKKKAYKNGDLSNYEQMCTLGTGTFGRVYLMRSKKNNFYYALKAMPIREIVRSRQIDHVHNEKQILENLQHPFIVKLHWSYHNRKCLFMMFDYMAGGELFSYLRCEHHFSSDSAQFYAAEIVLALEYLHSNHIVYRDLKPENLLLDTEGHVVITDFGFAKVLKDARTWTMCGTPEYIAPEIIEGKGHNSAVDWWSLGILVYEMIVGKPPFCANNPLEIYEKILQCDLTFPKHFDNSAKDLVEKVLVIDRTQRLGNLKGKAEDVKNHVWFEGIDWDDVYERRLPPPIMPKVTYDGDSGNFDEYEEIDLNDFKDASDEDLEFFEDW